MENYSWFVSRGLFAWGSSLRRVKCSPRLGLLLLVYYCIYTPIPKRLFLHNGRAHQIIWSASGGPSGWHPCTLSIYYRCRLYILHFPLHFNVEKTEFNSINTFSDSPTIQFRSGMNMKPVSDLKYRGSYIMGLGKDFQIRKGMARKACSQWNKISNCQRSLT